MKTTKNKIIAGLIILVVLVGAFMMGPDASKPAIIDDVPDVKNPIVVIDPVVTPDPEPVVTPEPEPVVTPEPLPEPEPEVPTVEDTVEEGAGTIKDKYLTDPVTEGKPLPVEPENVTVSDIAYECTLSVRCDTILDNMDDVDPEKVELVPEDGVIYETKTVTFYEGESVFNVLQREMKLSKTHLEFVNTPIYNSAYIEGINNLYEFDCGELSGWMYRVNDWFPNYGCSRYVLEDGDVIEWIFTCDLGRDIGGSEGYD